VTKPDDAADDEAAATETPAPAAPAKNRAKTGGGKFQKGKSGNPSGRKPGSRNKKTLMLEHMSDDDRVAIVSKIIRQAKRGDRPSQKMIVDRIEPPRKGRAAPFPLPAIKTAAGVVDALASVTAAMAAGQLSPAEAVEISAVIELQRRAIEMQDVEARLHSLEARFK
jgi:hypothetical protein